MRAPRAQRQRGVAVITALLLTTLAVTIVASLFWQQQVQVRSMENQRLHQQTKWITLGAIDLARFWLRQEDARQTRLDATWATPVEETNLDQFVERERVEGDNYAATLSGRVTDAQGRYNLNNLAKNRVVDAAQAEVFGRLLGNVQIDPALAKVAAQAVAETQTASAPAPAPDGGKAPSNDAAAPAAAAQGGREPMDFTQIEDLLSVPGFTPQALERLREFIIVLPDGGVTAINVNTAPAEVLAAAVNMSLAEAGALVTNRLRKPFNGMGDFNALIEGHKLLLPTAAIDIKSGYFLVASQVRLDRARLDTQALLRRENTPQKTMTLVWMREN
ncbi:type II secretion system minor pseudopilin GspK [Janthinobacterium sp.]|uniref:type II secretion system minor pseudopilin GspK n=1 Tax=Janthinobacterium sp. TaxID=1871054 RepID=UPI00293D1CFA|nr:type II secretion system minor pseudopilin GspK [Janthinobacterium sp.]